MTKSPSSVVSIEGVDFAVFIRDIWRAIRLDSRILFKNDGLQKTIQTKAFEERRQKNSCQSTWSRLAALMAAMRDRPTDRQAAAKVKYQQRRHTKKAGIKMALFSPARKKRSREVVG